jgi:hypothetical protein
MQVKGGRTDDALANERGSILVTVLLEPRVVRLVVALHGFKRGHVHHALDQIVGHILNSNEVSNLAHNRGQILLHFLVGDEQDVGISAMLPPWLDVIEPRTGLHVSYGVECKRTQYNKPALPHIPAMKSSKCWSHVASYSNTLKERMWWNKLTALCTTV